ncbi:hypothetical protein [Paraburkholderia phytofirmans]|uniref:Uncharacterized protein n=1 Tax=Paraburkholderia phytofirmans OLGA172 TaxID=1417228 RepID=A0A167WC27_9BURK|nr:hypothetical protein [Paraburkholderia phytofirmans]ANB75627.1 hypothetical protein AYM40_25120 [Paraburkholderia phytofirmans OLGA172]
MFSVKDEVSDVAAEIENLCGTLFDRWCEKRSVVPLAYLMHSWPLAAPTPLRIMRLSCVLRDLMNAYCESLDVDDRQLIHTVVAIANRVI